MRVPSRSPAQPVAPPATTALGDRPAPHTDHSIPLAPAQAPKIDPLKGAPAPVAAVVAGARFHASEGTVAHLRRKEALARLADTAPLAPTALDALLDGARTGIQALKSRKAVTAEALGPLYANLSRVETDLFAVLDEGAAAEARAKHEGHGKLKASADAIQDRARDLLREVGQIYAQRCATFSSIMLGEAVWPTLFEVGKHGKLHFINSFKTKQTLDSAGREAEYHKALDEFLGAGGQLSQIRILDEAGLDRLKVGERYEYVLLTDGRIRYAEIPKKEDGIGPGHSILAEGGHAFNDTRALCAGELWVAREPGGKLSAFCASAGSGHFKPYFDALSEIDGPLRELGVKPSRIIHYGGPSSARKAARKLLERAGLDKESARSRLPLSVPMRRLELHGLLPG